jgi:hypothetical protein
MAGMDFFPEWPLAQGKVNKYLQELHRPCTTFMYVSISNFITMRNQARSFCPA